MFVEICCGNELTLQIFSVAVILLWIMVSVGTLKKALNGDIFVAPCLKDLEWTEKKREKSSPKSQV